MYSSLKSAAILGAAVASANPVAWGPPSGGWSSSGGSWSTATSSASSAGQTPNTFPLANGFPNVSPDVLLDIEKTAQGTLPNGPPQSHISPGSATIFSLIAFNEAFEVSFFNSFLSNITNNVANFGIPHDYLKNSVVSALTAVLAQEELHFLGANGILNASGNPMVEPCEYIFPTNSFDEAIAFSRTFTDVVLGTLQDAQAGLAKNGDAEFLPLIGSVIGQEGEQNGFYRELLGLIPSAAPFLTRSAAQFAFSALNQMVVVPNSCHGAANDALFKALPIFNALTVLSKNIELKDQPITFSVDASKYSDIKGYSVTFINQQNVPFTAPVENVQWVGKTITFDAYFPAAKLIADGLTISALTKGTSNFTSIEDVVAATLAGPGLIEIN